MLQRTLGSLAVLAGAGGGAAELVVLPKNPTVYLDKQPCCCTIV